MAIDEAKARRMSLNAGEVEKLEELVREGYIDEAEADKLIDAGELDSLEDEIEEAGRRRSRDREHTHGRTIDP